MAAFVRLKRGRQPLLTEDLINKICNAMLAGAFVETACVVNGVSKDVFYKWVRIAHGKEKYQIQSGPNKGTFRPYTDKEREPYQHLVNSVSKAFEECNMRDLINIDRCAVGLDPEYMRDKDGGIVYSENGKPIILRPGMSPDWQASKWRLSKRNPVTFGDVTTVKNEITGADGGPVELAKAKVETPEEKQKRIEDKLARIREITG